MPRFMNNEWLEAALTADDEALRVLIDPAADTEDKFQPDLATVQRCDVAAGVKADQPMRILDFGCGLGRNILGILEATCWNVTGYDSPAMLKRAWTWLDSKTQPATVRGTERCTLIDDWNNARFLTFECVLASLVFQHIYELELVEYLSDLRSMTRVLVVHGRRINDDSGKNTWEIINRTWQPCNTPDDFEVDGEAEEHHTIVWTPRD